MEHAQRAAEFLLSLGYKLTGLILILMEHAQRESIVDTHEGGQVVA